MQRTVAIVLTVAVLATAAPRPSRADITSNLVAWYKLDETRGCSGPDSTGHGRTLTFSAARLVDRIGEVLGRASEEAKKR